MNQYDNRGAENKQQTGFLTRIRDSIVMTEVLVPSSTIANSTNTSSVI